MGGAALLALAILLILYSRRRKQRRNAPSVLSGSTYYARRNGEKGEAESPSSYTPPSIGGRSYGKLAMSEPRRRARKADFPHSNSPYHRWDEFSGSLLGVQRA